MADVVVAAFAEDLLLEFSTVIEGAPAVTCIIAGSGGPLVRTMPAGGDVGATVAQMMRGCHASHAASSKPLALDPADRVWTHSPLDFRPARARTTEWAARILGAAEMHCTAFATEEFGCLVDTSEALSRAAVSAKLRFAEQLCGQMGERAASAADVRAAEAFVTLNSRDVQRLAALAPGASARVSAVYDPWDFRTSAYEQERIARTADWVAAAPGRHPGPVLEVGSCEGAMTQALLDRGVVVVASEPDRRFRARLIDRLGASTRVLDASLEALAARDGSVLAAAWTLVEVLYYCRDLTVLDRARADALFVAASVGFVREVLRPWLAGSDVWHLEHETNLIEPRFEWLVPGRVYQRKAGSVGLALVRRRPVTRNLVAS